MARAPHHYTAYDKAYYHDHMRKHVERVEARRAMVKVYGAEALRGKDIDHIKALKGGGGNEMSNLRPRSVHSNRADKTY